MSNAKKAEPAAAAELFILHDQVHVNKDGSPFGL